MKTKYIISKHGIPVVFPETLVHFDVALALFHPKQIIGAGFCQIIDGKYECFGESISLNVKSNGEEDAKILNRMLNNP